MDFLVLGPIVVRGGADGVPLSRKPRELLGLLLTQPNRPRSAQVLIDRLWQQRPPATADSALRVHLSVLRAALCASRSSVSRLGRTSLGYVVTVEDGELDSERFERDVRAAEALIDLQPDEAAQRLRDALAVWRGAPFGDLDDLDDVDVARRYLVGHRLHAITLLADALLKVGKHEELAVDAARWLAEFPTSEHLASRQVMALYRGGDQVGALRAWRSFAEHLADEYGIDPTPEFRALETRLLLQSEERGRQGDASHEALAVAGDDPSSATTDLVERDEALREVTAALLPRAGGGSAVVAIYGEAGIGKTALVREVQRVIGSPVFLAGSDGSAPLGLVDDLIHQLGGRRSRIPLEGEGVVHGQIVSEVLDLLEQRQHPTIVVDDIDRCDLDSLEVARRLVRVGTALWVTTCRSGDLATHPLLQDREALARSHSLRLRALSRAGVRALAERHGWSSPDPAEIERLEHGSAGNPFLVVALARSVAGGADHGDISPLAIAHVGRLVAEIGQDANRWFEAAAVDAVPKIDVELVGRVSGLGENRSIEIAESALAIGLLGDINDELTFRHAIVRDAVLAGMTNVRRRSIHAAFARALLAASSTTAVDRLARHLRESHVPELRRAAAEATADEAQGALGIGAVLAAENLFGQAASLGDDAGISSDVLLGWRLRRCDALTAAGRLLDSQELAAVCAATARRTRDRERFVDAAVQAVGPIIPLGETRDVAEELVVEALEWCAFDGFTPEVRLCEAATRAVITRADDSANRVREVTRSILERGSEQLGSPGDQALAMLGLRALSWSNGMPTSTRTGLSKRALDASRRSGEPWLRMRAHRAVVNDLFAMADPGLAQALHRYADEAKLVGSSFHGWCAARISSAWMRARGDDDAATADALAAAELESAVDDYALIGAYVSEVVIGHVRTHRLGDLFAEDATGELERDVAPTVQLGRLAIAANAGMRIDPSAIDQCLAAAAHGPLRGAACAFAVLAINAAADDVVATPTATLNAIVGALEPQLGGVILIEGGIGCLGPVDEYLARCHSLLGDDRAVQYHRHLAEQVSSTFIPAWIGWTVQGAT